MNKVLIMNYKLQNKVTRKGTLKSTAKPWTMERITYSSPEQRAIIGSVVSIEVAPPAEIGASFPNQRTISGAPRRVMISLMMLASKATVPNSVPLYSFMNMLDSE